MTTTTATRCISNPTAMETFKAKGFNYKNYNINRLQSHDFIGVYYVGGFLNRKLSHSIGYCIHMVISQAKWKRQKCHDCRQHF